VEVSELTGDDLLRVLATLANPHRLRVVAALAGERNYVSQLARELGISRALLQVHLRKLEAAGLVSASVEISADGQAMKFYEVASFALQLTPSTIMTAARTLSTKSDLEAGRLATSSTSPARRGPSCASTVATTGTTPRHTWSTITWPNACAASGTAAGSCAPGPRATGPATSPPARPRS